MVRRRKLSPFNLAFLDIMFCGFGAVVLLVLLLNSQTVRSRNRQQADLRADLDRLQQQVRAGELYFDELQTSLRQGENEIARIQAQTEQERRSLISLQEQLKSTREQSALKKRRIVALSDDLKKLEEAKTGRVAEVPPDRGNKVRPYEGEGHRQYLTGLKLGGRRVLILVDCSASMLDTSVIGVLRRRNMATNIRQASAKWQQAGKTVLWLVANLPASSRLQVMAFNTEAKLPPAGNDGVWKAATDTKAVEAMLAWFRGIVPEGGTSLENALAAASALQPRPDNIVLLTDGLPTQGRNKPSGNLVSGVQRARFFEQAIKKIPPGVPVNTILFPMEGDPQAAVLYWGLAIRTRGSLLTPTADWP